MKTKKGFTIPELLAVIVILGVLITIAIGSYNGISNRMKQKTLENKLNYYKEAAYEYANDAEIDSETITIGYLGELGYFDVDHPDAVRNERIDNPVTGEYLDCRVLNITRNLDEYEIEDTLDKINTRIADKVRSKTTRRKRVSKVNNVDELEMMVETVTGTEQ